MAFRSLESQASAGRGSHGRNQGQGFGQGCSSSMAPGEVTATVVWERVGFIRVTVSHSGTAGSDWFTSPSLALKPGSSSGVVAQSPPPPFRLKSLASAERGSHGHKHGQGFGQGNGPESWFSSSWWALGVETLQESGRGSGSVRTYTFLTVGNSL